MGVFATVTRASELQLTDGEHQFTGTPPAVTTKALVRFGESLVSGHANGTYSSINTPAGFDGMLAHYQVDGLSRFAVDAQGRASLGQGFVPTQAFTTLRLIQTWTDTNAARCLGVEHNAVATTGTLAQAFGVNVNSGMQPGAGRTITSQDALFFQILSNGSGGGTVTQAVGVRGRWATSGASPSMTMGTVIGLYADVNGFFHTGTASISITNRHGVHIENQGTTTTGVTIVNAVGLRITNQTGATTTNRAIQSSGGEVLFQTGSDSVKGVLIRRNSASQSANLQEWQDSAGTALSSVGADGRIYVKVPNSAPTDGNLANSNITFYLDEANNAIKARIKYSNGTLKTLTVTNGVSPTFA